MSVYPDKRNGKLTGKFVVELQAAKRRVRERLDTYEAAKAREAELAAQLEKGEIKEAKPLPEKAALQTMSELLEKARPRLWPGGVNEKWQVRHLEKFVAFLGDKKGVNEVGSEDIDDFIEHLEGEGLAQGTVNRYLSSISTLFKWAKKRGHRTVELPVFAWRDEDEGRIRWITPGEEIAALRYLFQQGQRRMAYLVYVAIRTGCRRGELLSIQPDQIDPQWLRLWKTKNKTARSVPLTRAVHKRLVWLSQNGFPTQSEARYWWDKTRAALNLVGDPWFTFHATRHTCATRLIQANVNLRVVQQYLGHKTIQTTLRYAHVSDSHLAQAALAFADSTDPLHPVLSGGGGTSSGGLKVLAGGRSSRKAAG
jgi:integrase